MGAELREAKPELYDRYLDAADSASGLQIRQLSLEGPMESLTETNAAQPALFALSLALTEVARDLGLRPDVVAGHSLGEYTAAVAAGAVSLDDGMQLVSLRGQLMAGAQSERPGGMAAVIGLEAAALEELCRQASEAGPVAPANYNTPDADGRLRRRRGRRAAAGARRGGRRAEGRAAAGRRRLPQRADAADAGSHGGARCSPSTWSDPDVPMASNASGGIVSTGEEVRQALVDQIASPVRWVDCVRALSASGVTTFLELGPGRVLTGLVRQILGADAAGVRGRLAGQARRVSRVQAGSGHSA